MKRLSDYTWSQHSSREWLINYAFLSSQKKVSIKYENAQSIFKNHHELCLQKFTEFIRHQSAALVDVQRVSPISKWKLATFVCFCLDCSSRLHFSCPFFVFLYLFIQIVDPFSSASARLNFISILHDQISKICMSDIYRNLSVFTHFFVEFHLDKQC